MEQKFPKIFYFLDHADKEELEFVYGGRRRCQLNCCHSMAQLHLWREPFSFFSETIEEYMRLPEELTTRTRSVPTEITRYGSHDEEKAVIETPTFHSIAPKSFCFRCSWDCRMSAPRYRLLPPETDLHQPPLLTDFPDKVLPLAVLKSRITGDISKEEASNLSKKCEALAVSGLVDYGDEIDLIAPIGILKQVFKMPFSKSRVSIAVRRVGHTLVLSPGPDEEGEKLIRRENQDESLFLNFAMHSVRMEACDCPLVHHPHTEGQSSSSALPAGENSHGRQQNGDSTPDDRHDNPAASGKQIKQEGFVCEKKKSRACKPIRKNSPSEETIKHSGDSEKQKKSGSSEFLRVLSWKFHNIRMLLGSDLLLFSNEEHVPLSLHLWDVSQKVTFLTSLEVWLNNVMAGVPESAICYHQNGIVQRYHLLKTDDIILGEGMSKDIVQQKGLAVLSFLDSNCKDSGVFWLYKSDGEDVIQLFDLSTRSLGNLLYSVSHRLSLSVKPNDKTKCAKFLRKCLIILDEPDDLVRAYAHEQFARFILNNDKEMNLTYESNNVRSKVETTDLEEESLDPDTTVFHESDAVMPPDDTFTKNRLPSSISVRPKLVAKLLVANLSPCTGLLRSDSPDTPKTDRSVVNSNSDASFDIGQVCQAPGPLVQTTVSQIALQLAAIYHVTEAIKSLILTRQLQSSNSEQEDGFHDISPSGSFSKCACGDPDCIEVCDILGKGLPTSRLDRKLWSLVLLLGEAYISLGEAFKEDGQLEQALNTVELACSVYGSMPLKFQGTVVVSSMNKCLSLRATSNETTQTEDLGGAKSGPCDISSGELSSTGLFWAKVWMLVGDIYAYSQTGRAEGTSTNQLRRPSSEVQKIPSEVEEVQELIKKLTECSRQCDSCSLVNCSCKSDKANSGSSARTVRQSGKKNRKSQSKNAISCKAKHTSLATKEAVPLEQNEFNSKETPGATRGGIFKYLRGYKTDDGESNLLAAISCYMETQTAMQELPRGCDEVQAVIKRKGYVSNALGQHRLRRKELKEAEIAFSDALAAFKEVRDYTNVITINMNMGFGRRALADENSFSQEEAREGYTKSLAYYQAAERVATSEEGCLLPRDIKDDVYKQLANTYLKFGLFLANEDATGKTASDLIQKAVSLYESRGEIFRQEAAYGSYLLAKYQNGCCLRYLELKKATTTKKAKEYAKEADSNFRKACDFYVLEHYQSMYLKILIERVELLVKMSYISDSKEILETALSTMLEGSRRTSDIETLFPEFLPKLQSVLKRTVQCSLQSSAFDLAKFKAMYGASLKVTSVNDLKAIHEMWTSK